GVMLPDEVHRVVHDESRPEYERARALLDHLTTPDKHGDRPGFGTHWTSSRSVAEDFPKAPAEHLANEDWMQRRHPPDYTWGKAPDENPEEYEDWEGGPLGKPATAWCSTPAPRPARTSTSTPATAWASTPTTATASTRSHCTPAPAST